MSKVLDKKETIKNVEMKFKTVKGVKCDRCGKVIPVNTTDPTYYQITMGHSSWGSDSADSIEYHDLCPECLPKFVEDYFLNKPEYSGEICIYDHHYDTAFLEIATKQCEKEVVKVG